MGELPNTTNYKHISFDLWLTLIRSNPEYKPKRDVLFREYFAIAASQDEVSAAIRRFDVFTNSVNEKVGRNFHTYEIYCIILESLGADISRYSYSNFEEFYLLTEQLLMDYKPLLLNNEIKPLIKNLYNSGKTINILSNTAFIKGSSLRKIISHYGLSNYFSFELYSDETGFSKPSAYMYEKAWELIKQLHPQITKTEVLHIGDNAVSDYQGALNFGFGAHLITTTNHNENKLQPA